MNSAKQNATKSGWSGMLQPYIESDTEHSDYLNGVLFI